MPEDTGFYIDDVCIPHTWYPVETGRNDLIAFKHVNVTLFAYVPEGNYTDKELGVAIADAMNATIAYMNITKRFESTYDDKTQKITIKLLNEFKETFSFQIFTDTELKEQAPELLNRSMNTFIKNFTSKGYNNTDHVTGYIDMFPVRNIYMTSTGIGNFNTISVAGDRNRIKTIPVNAPHNEMIFDQTVTGMDYLDCSQQTLSRLGFQLRDVFGHILELNGNHISFSIVFSRVQDGT